MAKVGILSPYDMYRFGGVQEQVKLQYDELVARGHEVTVIAPQTLIDDPDKLNYVEELGRTQRVKALKTVNEATLADNDEINQLLEELDLDILHVHEPFIPVLARQVIMRAECPIVATFHGKLPETFSGKIAEMAASAYGYGILKRIDRIVAASPIASDLVRSMTDRPIDIITNALQLADWQREDVDDYAEFNDGVPTVFYIGRLEKRKGPYYLIKAYQELLQQSEKHVRLVIASDGPDREMLENYCERNDLDDVHFLGFISEQEKRSLLKTATVACYPALYGECFGIVLIEAMAMGTAVLAGDNAGYASVMNGQGELGLIDPKATGDFARRLKLLIENPPLRKLHIEWQNEAIQQYDISLAVDEYEKIYTEMING